MSILDLINKIGEKNSSIPKDILKQKDIPSIANELRKSPVEAHFADGEVKKIANEITSNDIKNESIEEYLKIKNRIDEKESKASGIAWASKFSIGVVILILSFTCITICCVSSMTLGKGWFCLTILYLFFCPFILHLKEKKKKFEKLFL